MAVEFNKLEDNPPAVGGTGFQQKMGGLPVWAWVALAAAGGVVFFIWRSRSSSPDKGADTSNTGASSNTQDIPAEGLDVSQYESLLALLRDIQGNTSTDPDNPDSPDTPGSPTPSNPDPTPPAAKTPTAPKPAPKPVTHKTVTVVGYTKRNPAWNSTLSGIASHEKTTVAKLLKLNPGIKNPNIIHPGQKVVVN